MVPAAGCVIGPWRPMRVVLALVLALVLAPRASHAQRRDGVYGRLDRDLVLSAELLGAAVRAPDGTWQPGGDLTLRARYLEMLGLALGYARALGGARADALFLAVDFRPAFLARINFDMQRGPRWVDLMLDSIGVELGAAWVRPGEPYGAGSGLAGVVGTGVELPLHWRDGGGAVMLRLGARWLLARAWDAQGTGGGDDVVEVGAGIVVRTMVRAGLYRAR